MLGKIFASTRCTALAFVAMLIIGLATSSGAHAYCVPEYGNGMKRSLESDSIVVIIPPDGLLGPGCGPKV